MTVIILVFIDYFKQQVPTVKDDSDEETELCVSGNDTESEGEENEQEEPSSDYYAWSSQGDESKTPDIEFEESDSDDEINEISFNEIK